MKHIIVALLVAVAVVGYAAEVTITIEAEDNWLEQLKGGEEVLTRIKFKGTGTGDGGGETYDLPQVNGVAPFLFWDEFDSVDPDIEFTWNFGDPTASHNSLNGWNGAHVFEDAGTYTVTRTAAGVAERRKVVVAPFAGKTLYVSAAGDNSNDGLSEGAAIATVSKAIELLNAEIAADPAVNLRILFRRGDGWTVPAGFVLPRAARPTCLLFGAYGEGYRPMFVVSTGKRFVESLYPIPNVYVFDLDISGGSGAGKFLGGDNHLLMRCCVADTSNPWFETYNTVPRTNVWLVDNEIYDAYNPTYIGSRQLVMLGNDMQRAEQEHVTRVWIADKGIISYNTMKDASIVSGRGNHALKLHSSAAAAVWGHTKKVWLEDNTFRGSAWPVAIAPVDRTDGGLTEVLEDIMFCNNVIDPDPMTYAGSKATSQSLSIYAHRVTTRGNTYNPGITSAAKSDIAGITLFEADPVVVQAVAAHGFVTGSRVRFWNVGGTTELNGNIYTVTVTGDTTFSLDGTDSSQFSAWTVGGHVTKNYVAGWAPVVRLDWYNGKLPLPETIDCEDAELVTR